MFTHQKESPWFVFLPKNDAARIRLFCFHHAGGDTSFFRLWNKKLPKFVEVVGVQLPGRGVRFKEPLLSDLLSVTSSLKHAILPYLDLPYTFLGHSLGGLVSFELIKELTKGNFPPPCHFIVSGRAAPSDNNIYYNKITHLPDSEFFDGIKKYDGIPKEVFENKEFREIYLPILRSDFKLADCSVEDASPISCPITVINGEDDKMPKEALELWKNETTSTFGIQIFSGGHFFLKTNESTVLKKISDLLVKIDEKRSYC